MRTGLQVAVILTGCLVWGTAAAQPKTEACPATFQGQDTETLDCRCDATLMDGPVWGTDIYTSDSTLCAAAQHAGQIGPDGGDVTVYAAPGLNGYAGTSRNGIESLDYGPWEGSFTFVAGSGSTAASGVPCPANFVELRGTIEPLVCDCAPGQTGGTVWGTGPYTDDSAICVAAVHAGVVGPQGGTVTVVATPGLEAYEGSTQNGVTTTSYGEWPHSFWFLGVAKP